jgi:predicted DNA-binding protein
MMYVYYRGSRTLSIRKLIILKIFRNTHVAELQLPHEIDSAKLVYTMFYERETMSVTKSHNINIRATENVYNTIKEFASFKGESVSAFLMGAALKEIEDWEDINDAKAALKSIESGETKVIPWEQVQKEAGLL